MCQSGKYFLSVEVSFYSWEKLGKSTCEPWKKVSFVYLLWLFEMFLDWSRCLPLEKTDLRTIKDIPGWLYRKLALPIAVLEKSSNMERKRLMTSPGLYSHKGRLCFCCTFVQQVYSRETFPERGQVCFHLSFNLETMSHLGDVPFCLKEHILNVYSWRPRRSPPLD